MLSELSCNACISENGIKTNPRVPASTAVEGIVREKCALLQPAYALSEAERARRTNTGYKYLRILS